MNLLALNRVNINIIFTKKAKKLSLAKKNKSSLVVNFYVSKPSQKLLQKL